ncbi:MAG: transcriptional regulator [Meiothermus sp.]
MTLREAQSRVDAWISQFEEGYFPHLLNLARLTEEVGEVARVVSHQMGKKPKPGEDLGDLGLELADILFVLICMANRDGIDLEEKFEQVLEKYRIRDSERWTRKTGS